MPSSIRAIFQSATRELHQLVLDREITLSLSRYNIAFAATVCQVRHEFNGVTAQTTPQSKGWKEGA
jgi:hypothetical protein